MGKQAMRTTICAVFSLALLAIPARAASQSDWNQCKDVNNANAADRNIAACTRIINAAASGRL